MRRYRYLGANELCFRSILQRTQIQLRLFDIVCASFFFTRVCKLGLGQVEMGHGLVRGGSGKASEALLCTLDLPGGGPSPRLPTALLRGSDERPLYASDTIMERLHYRRGIELQLLMANMSSIQMQ